MSFLQRLKGAGVEEEALDGVNKEESEESLKGVVQLDIDLVESGDNIVILAPVAGAITKDIQVSIEGDNDTVVIKGQRKRPDDFMNSSSQPEQGGQSPMQALQQMSQNAADINNNQEEDGEQIAIKNETKNEPEDTGEKFYSQDVKWGEFYRKIILPEAVDVSSAEVKIKNGILMMRLPILRRTGAQKHVLEIQKAE